MLDFKFRFVFWDVLPCKIIVDRRFRGTCLYRQGPDDRGSILYLLVLHGSHCKQLLFP
jgi:hypothetical protein